MRSIREECNIVGSSGYWGEREDWLIVAAQHRDSDVLDQSNFAVSRKMLKEVGEEGEDWAVEQFSHWAVGWVEYLIVNPQSTAAVAKGEEIRESLEQYPVLDDEDYSQREEDEKWEWHRYHFEPDEWCEICQEEGAYREEEEHA